MRLDAKDRHKHTRIDKQKLLQGKGWENPTGANNPGAADRRTDRQAGCSVRSVPRAHRGSTKP